MISCNEQNIAELFAGLVDCPDCLITVSARFYCGIVNTGVPDLSVSGIENGGNTMSGFARFNMTNGYLPVSRISTVLSATRCTLIFLS